MFRRTWFGAVAAAVGGLLYKLKPVWSDAPTKQAPCKREPFAHQLCEMTVTFVWDGDDLGADWLNEDNLKTLLYTDASTRRDLLHCCVHGLNETNQDTIAEVRKASGVGE